MFITNWIMIYLVVYSIPNYILNTFLKYKTLITLYRILFAFANNSLKYMTFLI